MDHCLWSQFSEQFKIAMVLRNDERRAPRIKGTMSFALYVCVCICVANSLTARGLNIGNIVLVYEKNVNQKDNKKMEIIWSFSV